MDLKNWTSLARESWKEHNPSLYKELNQSGRLGAALKDAAERTYLEVNDLEQAGHSPQDAWEMTREKYLLLPPEETQDEAQAPSLYQEANALQNQILQAQDETAEVSLI